MIYRTNGYVGCLVGILTVVLIFAVLRLTGQLVFGTPLGLILIGYFVYRHFKNKKKNEVRNTYEEHQPEFNNTDDVIDVDYEDVDSE